MRRFRFEHLIRMPLSLGPVSCRCGFTKEVRTWAEWDRATDRHLKSTYRPSEGPAGRKQ